MQGKIFATVAKIRPYGSLAYRGKPVIFLYPLHLLKEPLNPPPHPPFSLSHPCHTPDSSPIARRSRPCRAPISALPKPPTMVLTRGGHLFMPRVQTRTPARDGTSTSRAVVDHSSAQGVEAPPDFLLLQP